MDPLDIHPMRWMRNRPFSRQAVAAHKRASPVHGATTQASFKAVTQVIYLGYNEAIQLVPWERRPERPTGLITQEISLACHVSTFSAKGRNIFHLCPELVRMLDNTGLDGVRVGDLKMPFDTFHVSFGDSFGGALPGPPNRIDGAYVSVSGDSAQVVITSRRLDVSAGVPGRWPFSRDLCYYFPLEIGNPDLTLDQAVDQAVASGEITLEANTLERDGGEPAEYVDTLTGAIVTDVRHLTARETAAYNREGLAVSRRALALVANALCYLNCRDEEEEADVAWPDGAPRDAVALLSSARPKAKMEGKRRLLEGGWLPVRILGGSLPRQSQSSGLPEDTGRDTASHWRRGHYRSQPHGPEMASRRLVWIRPVQVNAHKIDPVAEIPGHVYRM